MAATGQVGGEGEAGACPARAEGRVLVGGEGDGQKERHVEHGGRRRGLMWGSQVV